MTRRTVARCLASLALAVVLSLSATTPARAQDEATPVAGEGAGRSFDGYFATGLLAFAALFAVAKTARR